MCTSSKSDSSGIRITLLAILLLTKIETPWNLFLLYFVNEVKPLGILLVLISENTPISTLLEFKIFSIDTFLLLKLLTFDERMSISIVSLFRLLLFFSFEVAASFVALLLTSGLCLPTKKVSLIVLLIVSLIVLKQPCCFVVLTALLIRCAVLDYS